MSQLGCQSKSISLRQTRALSVNVLCRIENSNISRTECLVAVSKDSVRSD